MDQRSGYEARHRDVHQSGTDVERGEIIHSQAKFFSIIFWHQSYLLIFLLLISACKSIRSTQIPTFVTGSNLGDTWVRPVDDMVMLFVPAGELGMGIDDEMLNEARQLCKDFLGDLALAVCRDVAFRNEQPVHMVELDSFWIDKTEIHHNHFHYLSCCFKVSSISSIVNL
jgi:formylglycine-generating enzyme required for sulfatase activity